MGDTTSARPARWALTALRAVLGWHLLQEGVSKIASESWTAAGYLATAQGPLAPLFRALARHPAAMRALDLLNMWGLAVVGLALLLGLVARPAAAAGAILLALYYAAHPALIQPPPVPGLGSDVDLIVNKVLVEAVALALFAVVPVAWTWGLDGWIARRRRAATDVAAPDLPAAEPVQVVAPPGAPDLGRRAALAHLVGLPVLGAWALAFLRRRGWRIREEEALQGRADAVTSATTPVFTFAKVKELKGELPRGRIGSLELSRVILGGNLIGGWAHARDLIYVSKLVKAYHHEAKIYETLSLAERCGVNALLTNPVLCGVINRYWKYTGGAIRFISDCGGGDVLDKIRLSIDQGAAACYVQGGTADMLVEKEKFDVIAEALELIRAAGMPAGIGGHWLKTVVSCAERGLKPDFWMKTLHRLDYWSARPDEPYRDNRYCDEPENVAAWMAAREEPWIAFKILAAGAIQPERGFRYAFESGADFICVGMYDFQIVEDINLALAVLGDLKKRQRPWRA